MYVEPDFYISFFHKSTKEEEKVYKGKDVRRTFQ